MSISALALPRNYDDNLPWNKARVDDIVLGVETWASQVSSKAADRTGSETVSGQWTFATPRISGAGAGFATLTYENSVSNRTHTIPAVSGNDTFAMLAGSQTLTNKTITAPVLSGTTTGTYTLGGTPTISAPKVTSGSYVDKGTTSGAITFTLTDGNIQKVTLNGNGTFTFSTPGNFERFLIIVKQDGTGSRTVTWPTTVRWLNGTGAADSTTDKPTLTTTANKFDVISFYYDSDLSLYIGSVVGFKGAIT